jgi:hypothetical protein
MPQHQDESQSLGIAALSPTYEIGYFFVKPKTTFMIAVRVPLARVYDNFVSQTPAKGTRAAIIFGVLPVKVCAR